MKPEFVEEFFSDMEVVEEYDEKTNEVRMRIIGQVQEAGIINRNKRLYPKPVLQAAIDDLASKIKAGQVFGEVDHPECRGKLKDSSHMLKGLWWYKNRKGDETNRLIGEMLVFNTPAGDIIKEVVRAGGRPGFSSRGRGDSTKIKVQGVKGDVERIEKGFKLDSFDFVIDPSVPRAKIHRVIESATGGMTEETMDLKELREKHAELVKKLKTEHMKEFKDDAEKIKKTAGWEDEKKTLEDRITALETELSGKDEEITGHLDAIAAIQKVLVDGEYLEPPVGDGKGSDKEKETLAADLATAKEDLKAAEIERDTVKAELDKIKEDTQTAVVAAYLATETAKMPYGTVIAKRLEDCKTKEEVDEGIKNYKEFVSSVLTDTAALTAGKGRGVKILEKEEGEKVVEATRKRVKRMAGIKEKEEK